MLPEPRQEPQDWFWAPAMGWVASLGGAVMIASLIAYIVAMALFNEFLDWVKSNRSRMKGSTTNGNYY